MCATYVATETEAGIKIYMNGERVDNESKSSDIDPYVAMEPLAGDLFIGGHQNAGIYSNGLITEVSLWGTDLSLAEVKELYNEGSVKDCFLHSQYISQPSELVAYWRNNGFDTWLNLDNPGTMDASPQNTGAAETILIPQGVDATDSQGLIMNRQRSGGLNLTKFTYFEGLNSNTFDYYNGMYAHIFTDPLLEFAEAGFTLSMWLKWTDLTNRGIHGMNDGSDHRLYIGQTGVGTDDLLFGCGDSYTSVSNVITSGEWIHALMTYDGKETVKHYVDGVLKSTATGRTYNGISTEPFTIGGFSDGRLQVVRSYNMLAVIDDLLIYRDVLSDGDVSDAATAKGDVARVYNAGKRSHK